MRSILVVVLGLLKWFHIYLNIGTLGFGIGGTWRDGGGGDTDTLLFSFKGDLLGLKSNFFKTGALGYN